MTRKAALGFRAHSGWTALVAVTGSRSSIAVVDRRKIDLIARGIPKQPFHAAKGLDLAQARALLRRSESTAEKLARAAIRSVVNDLAAEGLRVTGCGILMASGRPQTSLAATLASHAMIHSAEGELFRNAIVSSSERLRIPVTAVKESELLERAWAKLRIDPEELQRQVNELGHKLGPPWTQDEKRATIVAWLALAAK